MPKSVSCKGKAGQNVNRSEPSNIQEELSLKDHSVRSSSKGFLAFICILLALPAGAATPDFKLNAGNVSISEKGTATGNFTLTSVNGFTGKVGVTCSGPDPNLLPMLIMPSCDNPVEYFVVPAKGAVSGTMSFYPPWSTSVAANPHGVPHQPGRPLGAPLGMGALAAVAFLGLGFRRRGRRWLTVILLAGAGLAGLAGVAGCIGNGGLAMTPGTYSYVITGGSGKGESAAISVTVN